MVNGVRYPFLFPGATIAINATDATCKKYKTCKEVVGVATSTGSSVEFARIVIGTNSTNEEFLKMFDEVVKNFKVFEPPPSAFPPPSNNLRSSQDDRLNIKAARAIARAEI